MSQDPIQFAAGDVNLYAYVFNNPTNFFDPLGLICIMSKIGDPFLQDTGITDTITFTIWGSVFDLGRRFVLQKGVVFELIRRLYEIYQREQLICYDDCTGKPNFTGPILPELIGEEWLDEGPPRIIDTVWRIRFRFRP